MSTKVSEVGGVYVVITVHGLGKNKKVPGRPTLVPKGDLDALRAVIVKHAEEAREKLGVGKPAGRPVA